MEEIRLDVQLRDKIGTRQIKEIRRAGFIPAIVYGGESGPTAIKLDCRVYEKIMRQHKGQSVVFHLNVMEGEKKLRDYSTIAKEEQHDPVTDRLLHVDFKRISMTEEIEVTVAIVARGDASGVKNDGGSLDHAIWELDIACLPTSIPEKIDVDITGLNIGDAIYIKDIVLPSGVKTKHDPEAIVFSVIPPMKEEVEGEEEDVSAEPEVTKEKKDKDKKESGEPQKKAEG